MKILHTADLHLGKSVNEFDLLEDQKYMLEQLLSVIDTEHPDVLLISGDIYDRSVPPERAVELLDTFLTELSGRKIPTLVISGNHDSEERLAYGSSLFAKSGIHIAGKFEGKLEEVTLKDEYGLVHFYLLPFVKASTVRYYYPNADIKTYEDAVRTVIGSAAPDPDVRNVCLAHQFVTYSGKDPELSGSETSGLEVGTVERVGSGVFAPFDYTALGHIHGYQEMEGGRVVYSGSPLKYSLREIGQNKCFVLLDLGPKQDGKADLAIQRIPVKPLHEMRRIKGKLKDLLSHAVDTDDYIYATLTDEEPIPDAMASLQGVYPNAMKLDYENARTRALEDEPLEGQTQEKSFAEIAEDFARKVTGAELTDSERALLEDCAKQAGIL
ncbi:MAG: exonuclease SbcCD subunit D [Lachnospiraceae bacterium]